MCVYRISLAITLGFCLTALGEEPPRLLSTVIEGEVLNLEGSPIPEADVFAIAVGARDRSKISYVHANREGRFSLRIHQVGLHVMFASQEKEGYSVPTRPLPEVCVDEGQRRHSVVIRLGPKLGRFTGRVLDAETNRPVEKGQVELQFRSYGNALLRQAPYSKGQFQFSAPPSLFSLRVSAPGYEDWYGNGSKEQPETFAIEFGHHQEITVLLRPAVTR